MGCTASKVADVEAQAAAAGIRRHRQRQRKDSIVSSTGLLSSSDDGSFEEFPGSAREAVEEEEEEEKREEGKMEMEEKEVGLLEHGAGEEEEEVALGLPPASPSFRFYFVPRDDDEESVKISWMKKTDEKVDPREAETISSNFGQEYEPKSPKNERGRRLKALAKAPSRVYSFFRSRSFYWHADSSKIVA